MTPHRREQRLRLRPGGWEPEYGNLIMRIRMTDEREDRLRRLLQATGENTKAGAIDMACKHYLADIEAKRNNVDQLDAELADSLSTPYVPINVDVTRSVGREVN